MTRAHHPMVVLWCCAACVGLALVLGILLGRASAPVDVVGVHINLRVAACRDPLAPPVLARGVRATLGELLDLRHDVPPSEDD